MTDGVAEDTGPWLPETQEERISYLGAGHTLKSWLLKS